MTKYYILAAFSFSAVTANAQTDTLKGKDLDEVVMTANKILQKQSTTGKVISVITKEQIQNNTGKTVAQLLNEQAGIVVNGALNNAGSVQTVYMRGAASGRALILMDGVPVNDPSMINNEFDLNFFSLDNIERIEVCKGAQSTLYGSDAVSCVINIITIDPDVSKPVNVKATLSAGSFNTFKSNLQVYGKAGKLTYAARYGRVYSNGFSAAYDSTNTKNFDNDPYDGNVTNAQVQYQMAKSLLLKSFLMYSKYEAGIDAGIFRDDRDYNINNKNLTTGAGFQFKKERFSITGTYQFGKLKRTYLNDSLDKTSTIFEDNRYTGYTHFAEVYGNVNIGAGFSVVAGADYRYSRYKQTYFSVSSFGPYEALPFDTSLNQKAVYASVLYTAFKNKLNIELGGRMNDHSRYGGNSTYTFNPSYAITGNFRVFGSIASGFKAPTLYQLSINENLDPETSVNYEAGVQYNTKKLGARAVYFNRKIDNGIDYNYITFQYFNYVKQVVNGMELEATVRPCGQLSLTANYTWLSPNETTQNRETNQDTVKYDYSLRRPKHNINATFAWLPVKPLYLSVTGKYVSSRYDVGGYMAKDVVLDRYFILGAHAAYTLNEHVRFFADAENLTDKKFFDVRGYNAIPAMFNAGAVLQF